MQGYDILMLIVLAFTTFRGYTKGLAWQIASIASIVISYIVSVRFRDQVAEHIEMAEPWRNLVAMLLLFVGCSMIIWFLFQSMRGVIEKAKLKEFDKQMGAIFGAVKGAAICTIVTLFAVSLLQPNMSQRIIDSQSGGYIARVLANSERFIPSELHARLEPYLRHAEDRLQDRSDPNAFPVEGFPELLPLDDPPPQPNDWFGGANRSDEGFSNRDHNDWR